jgi:glycosyltransferase involved in cell wall biosynthesis
VIPGGVDCSRFAIDASRDECRARLGWPIDRRIVLCVRRLTHRMGLSQLVAAVHALRQRVPDVLMLIAGQGPLEATMRLSEGMKSRLLIGFTKMQRGMDLKYTVTFRPFTTFHTIIFFGGTERRDMGINRMKPPTYQINLSISAIRMLFGKTKRALIVRT